MAFAAGFQLGRESVYPALADGASHFQWWAVVDDDVQGRVDFYGESRRRIYTTLPPVHQGEGCFALLLRSMYGTEDAASVWQDTWGDGVKEKGIRLVVLFAETDLLPR